jgi:peptidoglycan/LPS O-acetylase OafA/YrhL
LQTHRHIEELQSLRGVAALVVAVSHMSSVYMLPAGLRISIDAVLNAHAALIIFFVLSGYVLTGSLLRRGLSRPAVLGFYVGRLFRLFPALWVASAISALFLWAFPAQVIRPQATIWFLLYLGGLPAWRGVLLAALAIDKSLIMPVWTIFIELFGSALMPLMVMLAVLRGRWFRWFVLLLAAGSYLLMHAPHRLDSLPYLFDFALGVWLGSRQFKFLNHRLTLKLFCSAGVLIFFRFLWVAFRHGRPMPLYDGYGDPVPMLVEGIAAFFLVGALAAEQGRVRLLRGRAAVWLGDVSYSLYLIHFPVVILVAKLLSRVFTAQTPMTTAAGALIVIALPISLGLATLLHRCVELPGIEWGKRVTRPFVAERRETGTYDFSSNLFKS